MRLLFPAVLLGALALAGCAGKKAAAPPPAATPRAAGTNQTLIVTPENALVGKVAMVNNAARRFVSTGFR